MVTCSDLVQRVIARLREQRVNIAFPLAQSHVAIAHGYALFSMQASGLATDEKRAHLIARAALYALAVEQADEADKQREGG